MLPVLGDELLLSILSAHGLSGADLVRLERARYTS
jgi:hypothetical protein